MTATQESPANAIPGPVENPMNVVAIDPSGHVTYRCPGCHDSHHIDPKRWAWNGDFIKPTFSPSVLVTSGHYVPSHKPGDHCWCTFYRENPDVAENAENRQKGFECYRCHSFVRDGMVELLGDCSHANAGKTLPILPIESTPADKP